MPPRTVLTPHPRKMDNARRVRDLIRSRLLDGEFSLGRLPDEGQLMVQYGTGRNVVRAALADLQREGLITRVQGAGTFAAPSKTRHTLQDAHGVAWSLRGGTDRLTSRVVALDEICAPLGVALRLGSMPDVRCLVADIVTEIDDEPVLFLTSYIADPVVKQELASLLAARRWRGDWYDVLARIGCGPVQREVVVEAAGVDAFIAAHLSLEVGDPIMRFERRLLLGERNVPEYGFSSCRGDRLTFAMSDGAPSGLVP